MQICAARARGVQAFDAALLGSADVIVDALLGIGVRVPLREDWQAAIAAMNSCGRPVLALDMPSGLDPDSGRATCAVRAAATITFIAPQAGSFPGRRIGFRRRAASRHIGHNICTAAGPAKVDGAGTGQRAAEAAAAWFQGTIRPRGCGRRWQRHAGAVRLAGEAALRVGAGLVTVASLRSMSR